jgi:hypothetical protein
MKVSIMSLFQLYDGLGGRFGGKPYDRKYAVVKRINEESF